MIEKTTTNRNYPKPDAKNFLQDDVTRLESALDAIDTDIQTINTTKADQTALQSAIDTINTTKADKTEVDAIKTKIETPPPIPVLSVTDRKFDGVSLSWTMVPEAAYYSLDVATDETFSSFVEDFNNKKVPGTSHEITGLQADTTYYFRVRSANIFAASENSNVLTVSPLLIRTFNYTGSIETWTVPEGVDSVIIEAWGAQGGNADTYSGGKGAYIKGTFTVSGGDVFKILVGQKGKDTTDALEHSGGTGGGGSFVALFQDPDYTPKLVAGGGGGAGSLHYSNTYDGQDGQVTRDGGTESENPAGVHGYGGTTEPNTGYHGGTGGGGFRGDGVNNSAGNTNLYGTPNEPGRAFVNGGSGGVPGTHGRAGGFGGGGAAGHTGGGGGGYSGGAAGSWGDTGKDSGGGGGSFNDGENQTNTAGVQAGNGKVVISW